MNAIAEAVGQALAVPEVPEGPAPGQALATAAEEVPAATSAEDEEFERALAAEEAMADTESYDEDAAMEDMRELLAMEEDS